MDRELRILLAALPAVLFGVATTSILAGISKQRWIWVCCPLLILIWLPVFYVFMPRITELLGLS